MSGGAAARQSWAVILHPHELEISSKTEEFDEALLLDNPEFGFLATWCARRRSLGNLDGLAVDLTYQQWASAYQQAALALGYQALGPPVLYQLRHGGVSHEALTGRRDAAAQSRRGRWSTERSVRRYSKGGAGQPGVRPAHPGAAATRTRVRGCRWRCPLAELPAAVKAAGGRCALEIFSGLGNFSRAWRRHHRLRAVPIFEVDIRHHADHDLTAAKGQRVIANLIKSGAVVALWLGTPCTSFSRARDIPGGGPGPLRSDAQPWGLDGLSEADQAKVALGNCLARLSARLLRLARLLQLPAVLENPHTSRLWLLLPFRRLLAAGRFAVTDYCQEGLPWRKRTGLLHFHVQLSGAVRRCVGHGTCSRSGKPHVQLRGRDGARFRTSIAEPYPPTLCAQLVTAFDQAIIARQANNLSELVGGTP